jgi:thiamine pyrophosphate-dependent acetolactate synthase large subunit-like protein
MYSTASSINCRRFDSAFKGIRVDIGASEIGSAIPAEVGFVRDVKTVAGWLRAAVPEAPL